MVWKSILCQVKHLHNIFEKGSLEVFQWCKLCINLPIDIFINKTDLVNFWSPRKQITKKMNFHLTGQKIRQKTCTKHLDVLLDKQLLSKGHINTLKQKLNRASGILAKLRHHLPSDILKIVYYYLYDKHLCYACQVWG